MRRSTQGVLWYESNAMRSTLHQMPRSWWSRRGVGNQDDQKDHYKNRAALHCMGYVGLMLNLFLSQSFHKTIGCSEALERDCCCRLMRLTNLTNLSNILYFLHKTYTESKIHRHCMSIISIHDTISMIFDRASIICKVLLFYPNQS